MGLQAVIVLVWAVVVYVAFLRPDDPGDLSGIEARGGDRKAQVHTPNQPNGPGNGGQPDGPSGPSGPSQGNGQPTGEPSPSGPTQPSSPPDTITPDTPPASQYVDTVTAIRTRLGTPPN